MRRRFFKLLTVFLTLFFLSIFNTSMYAQYFGRNKPKYDVFDFKVKQTPHFDIYYYMDNPELVNQLARDAERWYDMHQSILKDTIQFRNPILIYSNHADFQQTNVISGLINPATGGVTEGLKNRVVLPVTESYANTNHVLGHELVHAFQYNMMKGGDSTSLGSIRNLPLWMVEGLAEYMSIGSIDAHTAMWMRNAVLQDDVPSLEDMTKKMYEYFPYRYGQAFWAFVAGIWGDRVIEPLFRYTAMYGYEDAIDSVLHVEADSLSVLWQRSIKNHFGQYQEKAENAMAGEKLIAQKKDVVEMNISPAVSPDGNFLVYSSERSVFTMDLFLADANTGEVIKKLYSSMRNPDVDAFSIFESAGGWSPNGERFAFAVFEDGKNKLIIVDARNPGSKRKVVIPGVDAFSNPAWSPDGSIIVVSGMVNGQNDLYAYNIKTGEVEQLTNDGFAELQPTWSPNGRYLAFSTDRAATFDMGASVKSSYRIALLDVETENIEVFSFFPRADNLNPAFSPTGEHIYFLSDRDGFRNLYRYHLGNGQLEQLTDYYTGISGITRLSPAFSVAKKTGKIIYSHFIKGGYTLYSAQPEDFNARRVSPNQVNFEAATLPPITATTSRPVNANLITFESIPAIPNDSIEKIPYKPKFRLSYISNTSIGVAANRFGTGLAGGVNTLFSDILGNHKLFAGVALNGEIYDFGGQAAYVNQKRQLGWGASFSHIPYRSAGLSVMRDTLMVGEDGEDELPVINQALHLLRTFEDKASVFAFYPFSRTKRVEGGAAFSHYSFRLDRYNNYFYGNVLVDRNREKLDAPEGYNLYQINAAYVEDNSYFGIAAPLIGERIRFDVEKVFGELNLVNIIADYRRYFYIKPFSLAFRALHYGRYGEDARSERLYPLYLGNPTFVRGFDSRAVRKSAENNQGSYINRLIGSRMLVGNIELRLPFSGPKQLALIQSRWILTDLNLFLDGGLAYNSPFPVETSEQGEVSFESKPVFSAGVSVRVNLFGQLVIEPYYAIPIQENGFKLGNFGLNFVPGW